MAKLNSEEVDNKKDNNIDTKACRVDSLYEAMLRSLIGLYPKFPGYLSVEDTKELRVNRLYIALRLS